MPRRSKDDQDRGFMRSFWDEVRELETDHGASVTLFVHPSKRPGVFVYRMVAVPIEGPEAETKGVNAVQFEYPTALRQSLPAALWAYAQKLSLQCDIAYANATPPLKKGG